MSTDEFDLTISDGTTPPVPGRRKNNYSASVPPSITDDADSDYERGSEWATATAAWKCVDASVGAAVWVEMGGSGGTGLGWFMGVDYGVVADGVTDDTLAVQATIDAAGAAGGVAYMPPGEILISAETSGQRYGVRIADDDVHLKGAGIGITSLVFDPAQTLPSGDVFHPIEIGTASAGVSGVTVSDLTLIANHSALEAGGTEFIQGISARHTTTPSAHCDDITIERVRVEDTNLAIGCLKDGTSGSARTGSRHERWTIRDCIVDTAANKAFELDEVIDSEIVDCIAVNVTDGAQVANFSTDCRMVGNRIDYKDGGINITEGVSDVLVQGNILTAIAGGGVQFNGGIVIRRESYASTGPTSSRVSIVDNIIEDVVSTDKIPIRFASYTANTGVGVFEDYLIAGNIFKAAGQARLYDDQFPAKTSAVRLRVFDNYFSGEVMTHVTWSSPRTRFERNHVTGDLTIASNDWDIRGNVVGGALTITGTGYTLDDGYIRNVLVSATPPTTGDVLTAVDADSAEWDAPAAGVSDLDDLNDVTAPAPDTGNALRWNGSAWVSSDGFVVIDGPTPTITPGPPFSVAIVSNWGIDGSGDPYYDSVSVAAGEEAALVWDPLTEQYALVSCVPA